MIKHHKGKAVNLQQFVKCVQSLLGDLGNKSEIKSELVNLFSRINLNGQRTIPFR